MTQYGLIGFPLHHSFSAKFFNEKFEREQTSTQYLNFEIASLSELSNIIRTHLHLKGLNVTIPYKEQVLPLLDSITPEAREIGAVNTIKITRETDGLTKLIGYNTDYVGFMHSIAPLIQPRIHTRALILGTGGASKAVAKALTDLGLEWKYVSRTPGNDQFTYNDLSLDILADYHVIVNASPIGTFPDVDACPPIPYECLTPNHLLYDLVYNPAETLFLKNGKAHGATVKNGAEMLELQALAAYEVWQAP